MVVYESWVDRQIREAMERGEFDNLPGAGKPIPGLNGREDENWWIKGLIQREHLDPVLPAPLALRREVEQLPETLAEVSTEAEVREIVTDLNDRIKESYTRHADGPLIVIKRVDVEGALADWRNVRARPDRS